MGECSEKLLLVVPAEATEIPRVTEFFHTALGRYSCPRSAQTQLDIAVEELFANICMYAYRDAEANVERSVRLTQAICADPPSVTVEIVDAGVPFDPLAKPDAATVDEYEDIEDLPIGGLGILMAKSNVDEIRYAREGECNVMTLVKRW